MKLDQPTILLPEDAGQILASHKYTYAKSMPQWPHEYTLRRDWADDALFVEVVRAIYTHGYKGWFGKAKAPRRYFVWGGKIHWCMNDPSPQKTTLINRAEDVPAPYYFIQRPGVSAL